MSDVDDLRRLIRRINRILDPEVAAAFQALLPIIINQEVYVADIATALTDLDSEIQAVSGDVGSLQQQIQNLQSQGADTAALQAAADQIEQRVQSLRDLHGTVAAAAGDGGSADVPPADGGSTDVPVDNGGVAGGGVIPPGGGTDAPADGGSTAPADGGATDAPADGGVVSPGADGSTGAGGGDQGGVDVPPAGTDPNTPAQQL